MAGITTKKPPAPPTMLSADLLHERLNRAITTKRFLVACFRLENEKLHLDLDMQDFPHGDFTEVVRILRDELSKELKKAAAATAASAGRDFSRERK
jgi:hypothetical protein